MTPSPPNEVHYGSLPIQPTGTGPLTYSTSTSSASYNQLENGHRQDDDTPTSSSERAALLLHDKTLPKAEYNDNYYHDTPSSTKKKFIFSCHIPRRWLLLSTTIALCGAILYRILWAWQYSNRTFQEPQDNHLDANYRHGPLSLLDPVLDLDMPAFERPRSSQPTVQFAARHAAKGQNRDASSTALPTNAWYQSFLLLDDNDSPPTLLERAYSIPYIVDAAGPIAGLRIYPHHVGATSNVIQTYTIENQGLTMGLAPRVDVKNATRTKHVSSPLSQRYQIEAMTPLGITLSWMDSHAKTTVVKGMPYSTMEYSSIPMVSQEQNNQNTLYYPTIVSEIPIHTDYITIDERIQWTCGGNKDNNNEESSPPPVWVHNELQFYVPASDFTWLVFVSEPVQVTCTVTDNDHVYLQVVGRYRNFNGDTNDSPPPPFVLRSALYMTCTKNVNPIYCHQEQLHPSALHWGQGEYGQLLRQHSHLYAGTKSKFSYDFDDTEQVAVLQFDWDVQSTHYLHPETVNMTKPFELLSFALPHHWDMERTMRSPSTHQIYCASVLVGPACLVEGSVWHLFEPIPRMGLRAPRPPAPWALSDISRSLHRDLKFRLPDFFQRGAGDTYFSGKMLAKLGHILVMAEELTELCDDASKVNYDWGYAVRYGDACASITIPTVADRLAALTSLRKSVQVWLDGTAAAPFVYDPSWGGVANCGCLFEDGACTNEFPDCPAFSMPGLNFGNAFFNDMHFHYGYHIYAAAVVAHFDPDWGVNFFERVLLLIRNIANPSVEDSFFPVMRHKDPYQGHSWASGIVRPPYMNGRNQESSSESIAAYESVAIYGEVMSKIFKERDDRLKLVAAERVRRVGKYATTSELRATKRYYHINRDDPVHIYPKSYTFMSIGIMWQTMAQFQTWFGNSPYLVYGIQLLPMTNIGEHRDDPEWLKSIYLAMSDSCDDFDDCAATGWSVQILGSLAAVGHPKVAVKKALELPKHAFTSAGGDGHSLTNTLWYIATRPPIARPLVLPSAKNATGKHMGPVETQAPVDKEHTITDCDQPETCTDFVLDTVTDLYTCRQRIQWLMWEVGKNQTEACTKIATEFPDECGGCNSLAPQKNATAHVISTCPPCTERQCRSDLNRCPMYERTFVCTAGPNTGGCSGFPWSIDTGLCQDCCELSNCPKLSPSDLITYQNGWGDNECPVCSPQQCRKKNVCPPSGSAPYLCLSGDSTGGCSPRPWNLHNGQCNACCVVGNECERKKIVLPDS